MRDSPPHDLPTSSRFGDELVGLHRQAARTNNRSIHIHYFPGRSSDRADARLQRHIADALTGTRQRLEDPRAPEAPALGPVEVEVRGEKEPPRVHVQSANPDVVQARDIPQRHDGPHDDNLELFDKPSFIEARDRRHGEAGDVPTPLAVATQCFHVQVQNAETLVLHTPAVVGGPKMGEEPAADAPSQCEGLHVCCDGAEALTEALLAHTMQLMETTQTVETESEISQSRAHDRRDREGWNHELVHWEVEWPEGAVPGEEIREGHGDGHELPLRTSQVERAAHDDRFHLRQLRQELEAGVCPRLLAVVMADQLAVAAATPI